MPDYRRWFVPGGTYFFTQVTFGRAAFLCDDSARQLLRVAIEDVRRIMPFEINAFVLLPDHLHAIWTLPRDDCNYSKRWGILKKSFTQAWLDAGGTELAVSESRARNRRRGVWQRRFWEHVVRDEADLEGCMNYVHFNPVKHGLAKCPHDWKWSSFHRHVEDGNYRPDWCCSCGGRTVIPPAAPWAPDAEGYE